MMGRRTKYGERCGIKFVEEREIGRRDGETRQDDGEEGRAG